jgi:hypothetical protein
VTGLVLFFGALILLYQSASFRSAIGSSSTGGDKDKPFLAGNRENATLFMLVRYSYLPRGSLSQKSRIERCAEFNAPSRG